METLVPASSPAGPSHSSPPIPAPPPQQVPMTIHHQFTKPTGLNANSFDCESPWKERIAESLVLGSKVEDTNILCAYLKLLCTHHNNLPHNKEERPGYLPKFITLPTSFWDPVRGDGIGVPENENETEDGVLKRNLETDPSWGTYVLEMLSGCLGTINEKGDVPLPIGRGHFESPSGVHRRRRRDGLRSNVEHIFIPLLRDSTSLSGKGEHQIGTGAENLLALVVVSPQIRMIEYFDVEGNDGTFFIYWVLRWLSYELGPRQEGGRLEKDAFRLEEWRVRKGDCAILYGSKANRNDVEDDEDGFGNVGGKRNSPSSSSSPGPHTPTTSRDASELEQDLNYGGDDENNSSDNDSELSSPSLTPSTKAKRRRDSLEEESDAEYHPSAKKPKTIFTTPTTKEVPSLLQTLLNLTINKKTHIPIPLPLPQPTPKKEKPLIFGLHHACIYAFNISFGLQKPGNGMVVLNNIPLNNKRIRVAYELLEDTFDIPGLNCSLDVTQNWYTGQTWDKNSEEYIPTSSLLPLSRPRQNRHTAVNFASPHLRNSHPISRLTYAKWGIAYRRDIPRPSQTITLKTGESIQLDETFGGASVKKRVISCCVSLVAEMNGSNGTSTNSLISLPENFKDWSLEMLKCYLYILEDRYRFHVDPPSHLSPALSSSLIDIHRNPWEIISSHLPANASQFKPIFAEKWWYVLDRYGGEEVYGNPACPPFLMRQRTGQENEVSQVRKLGTMCCFFGVGGGWAVTLAREGWRGEYVRMLVLQLVEEEGGVFGGIWGRR